jgi:hypothetical protein
MEMAITEEAISAGDITGADISGHTAPFIRAITARCMCDGPIIAVPIITLCGIIGPSGTTSRPAFTGRCGITAR